MLIFFVLIWFKQIQINTNGMFFNFLIVDYV